MQLAAAGSHWDGHRFTRSPAIPTTFFHAALPYQARTHAVCAGADSYRGVRVYLGLWCSRHFYFCLASMASPFGKLTPSHPYCIKERMFAWSVPPGFSSTSLR